jgi:hypothetical protein
VADFGSGETATWLRGSALLVLAVVVAVGLAGAFILGRITVPRGASAAAEGRAARFAVLLQSLDLDADQRSRADRLFAEARRRTETIRDPDTRGVAYRALLRRAMTTMRETLNSDQRAVLDQARAREAMAEASSERAEKARLDQVVASLALTAKQRAIAAPLLARAATAAAASDIGKADNLDAGYRCAFFTLEPALDAQQRAKLDAARRAGTVQTPP